MHQSFWKIERFWVASLLGTFLAASGAFALDINLEGYGTPPAHNGGDCTLQLQAALDAVGEAGGGHVYIPKVGGCWTTALPIFMEYPNVSIVGLNGSAEIRPGGNGSHHGIGAAFMLGWSKDPQNAAHHGITDGHYPTVTMDSSVGTRIGMRTKDNQGTTAFGYFPECNFAMGRWGKDDFVGVPTCWQPPRLQINWGTRDDWADYKYTLEVAIQNNAPGVMRGTLCGVGAPTVPNNMNDRSMIWKLATDPAQQNNLTFYLNLQGGTNEVTTVPISFNANITDQALHRLTVQIDLSHLSVKGNQCTVWLDNVLKNMQPLPAGSLINEFKYGAFRLGDITASPLSGNLSGVDWTYAGAKLSSTLRYDQSLPIGAPLTSLPETPPEGGGYTKLDDAHRFFSSDNGTVDYIDLLDRPTGNGKTCVPHSSNIYKAGSKYAFQYWLYGFWLPDRPAKPLPGTLSLQNLNLYTNVGSFFGESTDVNCENIYFGGVYAGFTTLECPNYCTVELSYCGGIGGDAYYIGSNQCVTFETVSAYPGLNFVRFHGVNGVIHGSMVNDPGFHNEYYIRSFAGQGGGPLTLNNIWFDNEGNANPRKALIYHEASVNPVTGPLRTSCRNGLVIQGVVSGTTSIKCAFLEIKDNPLVPPSQAGIVKVIGANLFPIGDRSESLIVTDSPNTRWTGTVYDVFKMPVRQYLKYTGPGQCGIKILHSGETLPPAGGPSPSRFFGSAFKVGAIDLTVTELGRWCYSGNKGSHRLVLTTSTNPPVVVSETTVSLLGAKPGQFVYASLPKPVTLTANTGYYLLSYEPNTCLDTWGDYVAEDRSLATLTTTTAAAVTGNLLADDLTRDKQYGNNDPLVSYGPVNFKYGDGTPWVTSAVLGQPIGNGQWVAGCDIFTAYHPLPDAAGNKYLEYHCTKSGAPGAWLGVGKIQ